MRSRLIDNIVGLVRKIGTTTPRSSTERASSGTTRRSRPAMPRRHVPPPSADTSDEGLRIEYSPNLDGDPDPGEVVWTWVPYEDDPSQGKDRPVVIIGRRGDNLAGVPLTSKAHDNELQVVGRHAAHGIARAGRATPRSSDCWTSIPNRYVARVPCSNVSTSTTLSPECGALTAIGEM